METRMWKYRGLKPITMESPDADVYARLHVLFVSILGNHNDAKSMGELTEEDRETMRELMPVIMVRAGK